MQRRLRADDVRRGATLAAMGLVLGACCCAGKGGGGKRVAPDASEPVASASAEHPTASASAPPASSEAATAPQPQASAAGADPPPLPDAPAKVELSPLDALAKDAEAGASFQVPDKDAWTLLPAGTTECGTDTSGRVVRLDQPAASDEFEAERLKNARGEIAKRYAGKILAFVGSGNASGNGFRVGAFTVALGKYDFATHRYPLTISAGEQDKWPLTSQAPILTPESVNVTEDRQIAKIGGKKVTVQGQRAITSYINKSSMTLHVDAPTAEAEEMKSSAPADVLLLMRFVGLGYHKACVTDCGTILGIYSCVGVNTGFGTHYRADLVGFRIKVGGRVVAEKQPMASVKKP